MKAVKKVCLTCSKHFDAPLREVKRGNGKYCSRSCSSSSNERRKKPNITCAHCNKPFYKSARRQTYSKSGLFFCCREHKDAAQRIEGLKAIHPDHYGTGNPLYSYRALAFRKLEHKCGRCQWHKITEVLEVHHKDCNRANNELSNLEILCPNCHAEEHFQSKTGKFARKE